MHYETRTITHGGVALLYSGEVLAVDIQFDIGAAFAEGLNFGGGWTRTRPSWHLALDAADFAYQQRRVFLAMPVI